MRISLFEFEDLSWFPNFIREGGTDYLRYFLNTLNFYKPASSLIAEAIKITGDIQILDLCSGGGGSIESLYSDLKKNSRDTTILLSDKFPNQRAFEFIKHKTDGLVNFISYPVDATDVPREIKGFRTMFSAIHHFEPDTVGKILKCAIDNNSGIGIFDGGDKNIFTILGIILFHPIAFVLFTPFFKPFRFSRLFFTYVIPLIPIYTIWDGCISIMRLYSDKQLLDIAQKVGGNYLWKSGKVKNKFGMNITFLIGYPK
jgi:hypothetical protein